MGECVKVWFLASEVAPFAKTGGLADVAGSLPRAIRKLGLDVRVGVPYYRTVNEGHFPTDRVISGLEVPLGDKTLLCDVLEAQTDDGVPVFFFDRQDLFYRPHLYGTPEGDYPDNLERFSYFNQAALLFARKTEFRFDVVHCHDWQTGLIPAYVKTLYCKDPFFSQVASVFTIHNMGYQGLFAADKLSVCGLPRSTFHPDGVEYWGKISLLKGGIVYADAIATVSPGYSREIQTPEYGLGMDGLLKNRSVDLYGILNGADYSAWDPAADPHISAQYSHGNMKGKRVCKAMLVREVGLEERCKDRPIFAVISRLTAQKGYDLLLQIVDDVVRLDAGLVILGAGEQKYQRALGDLAQRYHERIAVRIGFDEPLARRILAGADMLLVPSRYEPCGMTQIYALRYGTVPIVRATGGLSDTIQQFDPKSGEGTGFKFVEYEKVAFLAQIQEAVRTYYDGPAWERLIKNGMKANFSWEEPAQKYASLYEKVVEKGQEVNRKRGLATICQ